MNKNEARFAWFIDQCNRTPLSKDWREANGPITTNTIKSRHFRIQNPHNVREVIAFVTLLNKELTEPIKFGVNAYEKFCRLGEVPQTVSKAVNELLTDEQFNVLVKKLRSGLQIPNTGRDLIDPEMGETHHLTEKELKAVHCLCLYSALTSRFWEEFFSYLLIYNYLMPITWDTLLITTPLFDLVPKDKLQVVFTKLDNKVRILPLSKRQKLMVQNLLAINQELALEMAGRNEATADGHLERQLARVPKKVFRKLVERVYQNEPYLERVIEAVDKRKLREHNDSERYLKDMANKLKIPVVRL